MRLLTLVVASVFTVSVWSAAQDQIANTICLNFLYSDKTKNPPKCFLCASSSNCMVKDTADSVCKYPKLSDVTQAPMQIILDCTSIGEKSIGGPAYLKLKDCLSNKTRGDSHINIVLGKLSNALVGTYQTPYNQVKSVMNKMQQDGKSCGSEGMRTGTYNEFVKYVTVQRCNQVYTELAVTLTCKEHKCLKEEFPKVINIDQLNIAMEKKCPAKPAG